MFFNEIWKPGFRLRFRLLFPTGGYGSDLKIEGVSKKNFGAHTVLRLFWLKVGRNSHICILLFMPVLCVFMTHQVAAPRKQWLLGGSGSATLLATLIFRKIQTQAPDNYRYPNSSVADPDSFLNDPDPYWNCWIWIRLKLEYDDGFIGYNWQRPRYR